jgi:hypothetical protein
MRGARLALAAALCLLAAAAPAAAAQIAVDWTLGAKYAPLAATVGDELVFSYAPGLHDVWRLPAAGCDFGAPGAAEVGAPSVARAVVRLEKDGPAFFACSTVGHCAAGQVLEVDVRPAGADGGGAAAAATPTPAAGGACGTPEALGNGTFFVSCLGPPLPLGPGDNAVVSYLVPNPLPAADVVVRTQAAQVVDGQGQPVPLSQAYLHHVFGSNVVVAGEGAEVRGSPLRAALPAPLGRVVRAAAAAPDAARTVNLHLIDTRGVAAADLKPCIECWCRQEGGGGGSDSGAIAYVQPPTGSVGCCRRCPSALRGAAPDVEYRYQYNTTYEVLTPALEASLRPVFAGILDLSGRVEYDVAAAGPGAASTLTRAYPTGLDFFCPQAKPFAVARCWAHQHIGGKYVALYDGDVEICRSTAVYGNATGAAGNEEGYLVAMTGPALAEPYVVAPGRALRAESVYDASMPYAGVMSALAVELADFDARPECALGAGGFIRPPAAAGSAAELEAAARALVEAVPPSCGGVSDLVSGLLAPCLGAIAAEAAGGPAADEGACCAAVDAGGGAALDLEALAPAFFAVADRSECLCPFGELLLYAQENALLAAVAAVAGRCGAEGSVPGVLDDDALLIAIRAYFAPQCPALRATLDGGGEAGAPAAAPAAAPEPAPAAPAAAASAAARAAAARAAAARAAAALLLALA